VGAPAPLQAAGAVGFSLPRSYFDGLSGEYLAKRAVLADALAAGGFRFSLPQGAYYVLADYSSLSDLDDTAFALWLTKEVGVAPVPGSSFYHDKKTAPKLARFVFCKKNETLERAAEKLAQVAGMV
jgi:aminotransferase